MCKHWCYREGSNQVFPPPQLHPRIVSQTSEVLLPEVLPYTTKFGTEFIHVRWGLALLTKLQRGGGPARPCHGHVGCSCLILWICEAKWKPCCLCLQECFIMVLSLSINVILEYKWFFWAWGGRRSTCLSSPLGLLPVQALGTELLFLQAGFFRV